jgi:hypothetical protein
MTLVIKRKSKKQKAINFAKNLKNLLQRTQGRKAHNAVKYLAYIILSFVFREIWYAVEGPHNITFSSVKRKKKLKSKLLFGTLKTQSAKWNADIEMGTKDYLCLDSIITLSFRMPTKSIRTCSNVDSVLYKLNGGRLYSKY